MAIFFDDFSGAENQLLSARAGWSILGSGNCRAEINNDNNLKSVPGGNGATVGHDTGVTAHYVRATAGAQFSSDNMAVVLRCTDRNDFIGIRHVGGNWEIWNNFTGRMSYAAGSVNAGDIVYAEVLADNTVNLRINGTQVLTAVAPGKTGTHTGTCLGTVVSNDVLRSFETDEVSGGGGPPTGTISNTVGGTGQTITLTGTHANADIGSAMMAPSATANGAILQGPKSLTITGANWTVQFESVPPGNYDSSISLSNFYGTAPLIGPSVSIIGVGGQPQSGGEPPPADMQVPVMSGALSITNKTTTGYTVSGYSATDNSGVIYFFERSLDGGFTWVSVGAEVTFNVTGQTPGSTNLLQVRAVDPSGNPSDSLSESVTLNTRGDTSAPVISSATGVAASSTTANGTVTTNEANGILRWRVNTSSTATKDLIKTSNYTLTVTQAGLQNVSVSDLNAGESYYLHYLHTDSAGNDSNVVSSAVFVTPEVADTTAPTLASATAAASTATASTGSVSTNEEGGTLYWLTNTSSTASDFEVKAGSQQAVVATGVQSTISIGLKALTGYYTHYLHQDAAGNESEVMTTERFETPLNPEAAGFEFHSAPGMIFGDRAGGGVTGLTRQSNVGIVVRANNPSSGEVVATSEVLFTGSGGTLPRWTHEALSVGDQYELVFKRVSDNERCITVMIAS